jgi:hypothetical protein
MGSDRGSGVLSGPERVEHCDALGRPLRKGDPVDLRVSDIARVRTALQQRDFTGALALLAVLGEMYSVITGTFLEWCLALPAALAQAGHADRAAEITRTGYRRWRAGISSDDGVHTPSAIAVMSELLAPDTLSPETMSEYRVQQAAGLPSCTTALLAKPGALHAELIAAAQGRDTERALSSFSKYVSEIQSRHDLAGEFVSSYVGTVQDEIDQDVAAAIMQTALESCAVLKGMWDLFVGLTPELLAAVLAEHLRGHFSGPGREGAVTIVEEADRYRLVFEPCGTGGAMRRRKIAGLTNFRNASVATWQRTNEVPTYCAHCALNEVTSIQRLGYPAWVTEFDPDPEKPCGWTVYKDPDLIPERYFTRLGHKKGA